VQECPRPPPRSSHVPPPSSPRHAARSEANSEAIKHIAVQREVAKQAAAVRMKDIEIKNLRAEVEARDKQVRSRPHDGGC
jgi:hypothetical protein